MMHSYEDYEKDCAEVRKTNSELLQIFEEKLKAKGLSSKTIRNHMENVELYISDYLLREEAQAMEKGVTGLDGFFSFYIHKCMWSTPASVKGMGASLKKFYKCMMEQGKLDKVDYQLLEEKIKESMPFWEKECARFNG